MKYARMSGLVAIAAITSVALLGGAGTASATALCSASNETAMCANNYSSGTVLHATLTTGRTSIWEAITGNPLINTCPESTMKITTSNAGSTSETIKGSVLSLTWGSCIHPAATLKSGEVEIHHSTSGSNLITTKFTEITSEIFGVSCVYGAGEGVALGEIISGNPATISVNAVLPKVSGSFLCPGEMHWTATYTFTAPNPLHIVEGRGAA